MRLLFAAAVLVGALALAGTQRKDSNGVPPSPLGPSAQAERLGVPMEGAVGCRCSIRLDAGVDAVGSEGLSASGKLVPWYYDPWIGWVESKSSLHCSLSAKVDGGTIRQFVCPDMEPLAAFGRLACAKFNVFGVDGGTGADLISDAGAGPAPVVQTSCWGPGLSSGGP